MFPRVEEDKLTLFYLKINLNISTRFVNFSDNLEGIKKFLNLDFIYKYKNSLNKMNFRLYFNFVVLNNEKWRLCVNSQIQAEIEFGGRS